MSAVLFLIFSVLIRIFWPKLRPKDHWLCPVLAIALPFAAGGFHTGTNAVLSGVLMLALWEQCRKNGGFAFCLNWSSLALAAMVAGYCLTPLWAADKGMAPFAFPRYLPVALFALLRMQEQDNSGRQLLEWIPISGCIMTVLALAASTVPAFSEAVTVNGRLAGFFQYPNTFAAFLFIGLLWQCFRERSKWDLPILLILCSGIVLSGSKTVFVLLMVLSPVVLALRKQRRLLILLGAGLILSLGIGLLADCTGVLTQADRFTQITSQTAGSFLGRLLYFRDVIPYILRHPLGIGYLGYPAVEGILQTSRYSVTYLHNELLQLLLEIGWVPALAMTAALLRSLLSQKLPVSKRLVLLGLLGHCMLDFDLQFSVMWLLILCCMDFSQGTQHLLPCSNLRCAFAAVLLAVSLWLGSGDWLYRMGNADACLAVTPFHTEALTHRLKGCSDAQQVDTLADRILAKNPTHSLAHSAKANVALARGDVLSMIRHKEEAIQCAPYVTAEYCDYFQKLYTAMNWFLQARDTENAVYCRDKLLQIPEMMAAATGKIPPLAYRTGVDQALNLPQEYLDILSLLEQTR